MSRPGVTVIDGFPESLTAATPSPPARPEIDHAARHVVGVAVTAPSIHNTQPWLFARHAGELDLYADPTRRLPLTDPDGREQIISCGAALFNVRLAVRHLGFLPVVRPFPDAGNPAHLAHVGWGPYARPDTGTTLMYRSLWQRRTYRGVFQRFPLPRRLVDELREHARAEGAELRTMESPLARHHLAELVRTAEAIDRADPGRVAELLHWTRLARGEGPDGVPPDACTCHPDGTGLAGRDFLRVMPASPAVPLIWPPGTGLVLLLTTRHDTREDWLRTGQALQRVLLHATARWTAAAFHTQPLEIPSLRAQLRSTLTRGEFPQMILRLGHTTRGRPIPRRPVDAVLTDG
ncbi:Acg family FMN-binding oxidoreductase [Streptomyces sp. 7R007]